ncbi:MAG TPA: deoxyguanosinetriphosphate triphosphohydrolase [Spirochaetia bacterium]|nr:deoxyguanosinetriphosphate triphosphohydrolase [Spirochaetia bacterium]
MKMNWNNLLSEIRLGNESKEDSIGRSNFHKDYDRIVFSSSFRRLGKKTQVHPMTSNDHIHTRLTHSIEVSCVARSLGFIVGEKIKNDLPENITPFNISEIVQAASLAHDIGNPPFGHAGEEAIKSWFREPKNEEKYLSSLEENQRDDLKNFEGNAQGFRIITKIENNFEEGGLKLTYSTLGTFLKYPWTTRETKRIKKFSSFITEENILSKVCDKLGLIKIEDYKYKRHPLAYLVECADDICYRILDLEDAHELKIMNYKEIEDLLKPVCETDRKLDDILTSKSISNRRKVSYLRAKAINTAIIKLSKTFLDNLDKIMEGNFEKDLFSANNSTEINQLNEIKKISKEKIYSEPRKIELEIGSFSALGNLLDTFCSAVKEKITGVNLSFRSDRILSMMGINCPKKGDDLYQSYMKVLDYLSGMTDHYATYMSKQISGDAK